MEWTGDKIQFRVPGFGFRVPGFGFRVLDFKIHVATS